MIICKYITLKSPRKNDLIRYYSTLVGMKGKQTILQNNHGINKKVKV